LEPSETRPSAYDPHSLVVTMNQQQHDNLPPPPPRSPNVISPNGSPFAAQHRRPVSMIVQQRPSLTTNIARTLGAPHSAHTLAPPGPHPFSPATPSALNPHSPGGGLSPSSASPRTMEPYNPRQWSHRGGQVSGTQMVFQQRSSMTPSTREVTGMEGMLLLLRSVCFDLAVVRTRARGEVLLVMLD